MAKSNKDKAHNSQDNTGIDPTLSGIDAKADAPDTPSGASSKEDLIAQAEEILAAAVAESCGDADTDAEAVEAEILEEAEEAVEAADVAGEEAADTAADAADAAGEADAADDTNADFAALEAQLADAKADAADWQGRYMRLYAEWDTYRRRTAEDRKTEKARATEKLVEELLPVIDDFERTIAYGQTNGEEGLLGGVEAVHSKLVGVLTKSGVEVINPVGQAYDALEAQAVAMVDDSSVPDETVAQVYQKGYKMGGHVLRSAMVTVATGGPKRDVEAE